MVLLTPFLPQGLYWYYRLLSADFSWMCALFHHLAPQANFSIPRISASLVSASTISQWCFLPPNWKPKWFRTTPSMMEPFSVFLSITMSWWLPCWSPSFLHSWEFMMVAWAAVPITPTVLTFWNVTGTNMLTPVGFSHVNCWTQGVSDITSPWSASHKINLCLSSCNTESNGSSSASTVCDEPGSSFLSCVPTIDPAPGIRLSACPRSSASACVNTLVYKHTCV